MSEARPTRRRRSVARSPALVDPADIPDDAPGRVVLIAVRAPEDVVGEPSATPSSPSGVPAAGGWPAGLVAALDGWLVVILVCASLLIVFIVGMAVTR